MLLSKNPIFLKHKIQIEEALHLAPESARNIGEKIYQDMLSNAEMLDSLVDPFSKEKPTPQSVTVKRDQFHKSCKDMGEWLTRHAPNVILTWD